MSVFGRSLLRPGGIALLLWAAHLQVAHAQTLGQALDAAWGRYPPAASLSQKHDEAKARQALAESPTPAPSSLSVAHVNDRTASNAGNRSWEIEWSTPVWLPGQRRARIQEAAATGVEVTAQADLWRWQLAGEVREAWWRVAAARQAQALAQERLQAAQELAALVQRRVKAGDLSRMDGNLAQAESLAAQSEVVDATSAVRDAESGYRMLTGVDAPAQLPAELAPGDGADLNAHPWVRAAQASVNVAHERLVVVDASRRDAPELALRWTTERSDMSQPYAQAVGIKVTLPLSSDYRMKQEGAAARAEVAQRESELTQTHNQVALTRAKAQGELDAAKGQLALAQEQVRLTRDNLELAKRSFELGEFDLPTYLRARIAHRDATVALQRQGVAHDLAVSRLLQAQGALPHP